MKKDRVSIRLPEELQNFEAFGFKSITEYIKTALVEYNEKKAFEILKTNQILSNILQLITVMEAERDHSSDSDYPEPKGKLIAALYESAKSLSISEMIRNSPINNIAYPNELKDGEEYPESFYTHTWAF